MDQHSESIVSGTNTKTDQVFKCLITDKDILSALLGMLNTLFSGKIDDAKKVKELMKNSDIDVSDTILEEAKRMGALAEEMEIVREEGREEGREGRDAELVGFYAAEILKKKDETGRSVEEILSETIVPPELLDPIKDRIREIQRS